MKINLYSVYDKVSGQYNTPFGAPNDTHAVRSFRMEVNRPNEQNVVYHNAKDFKLVKVGTFDHETGTVGGPEAAFEIEAATLTKESNNG